VTGVSAVITTELDAEELVDLVWRLHHEVAFARQGPPSKPVDRGGPVR
jgi:hypothetical protein